MTVARRSRPAVSIRYHRGYAAELRAFCQRHHLLGFAAPLTDVLIEPRFVQKPPLIAPIDENLTKSVMFRVPQTHEYPALYASYNITTHSLEEVGLGARHIAIQGVPGSGRTTALMALALYSMGAVSFPPPRDAIQERLAAEEKKLKPEERAERVKRNVQLAQKTREGLANISGQKQTDIMNVEDAAAAAQEDLRSLAPMYVHLADITLKSVDYGSVVDPTEPLMRALQDSVSYVTAQMMPPLLYSLLERGRALLLLDGLDETPHAERSNKLAWLKALLSHYGSNRIVLTSGTSGGFELQDIGFHTVYIRPWSEADCEQFYHKVSAKVSSLTLPVGADQARWLKQARLLPVREVVLSLLQPEAATPGERITAYVERLLPSEDDRALLSKLASLQLHSGAHGIRPEHLIEATSIPPEEASGAADGQQPAQSARQRRARLLALMNVGLLVKGQGGQFRFAQPAVMAALAAPSVSIEQALAHLDDPDWDLVLCYVTGCLDAEKLAAAALAAPPTVDLRHLLHPAHWLPHAVRSDWRVPYLRLLAHWLMQPNQYLYARQTIAAALVMSGDPTTHLVFRRMLMNPNPDCRQVAALALGALKDTDATQPLAEIVKNNSEDLETQIAATLALGAMHTETAGKLLIAILNQHYSSDVKRAAAESLAALPELGYPVLYEAVRSKDDYVRRAVVWGLGRIGTDWALIALNEIFLEDKEEYVRLAVHQVYADRYEIGALGIRNYPKVPDIEWIQTWSHRAIANQIIPNVRETQPLVLASMQQRRDPQVSLFFVILAGQQGFLWAHNALYKALFDPQPAIRDYAYRSLCELAQGWSVSLPYPA
jgi:HEAT repeat protein